jgi:c-di-GMP-binding flagellar brake protein YcgR
MSASDTINRRAHERFKLPPMYTSVVAQCARDDAAGLDGHAYDISESGVRIELDDALRPGEQVALNIGLPGEEAHVAANARVVWLHDAEDDPGPRRMALEFTGFVTTTDRDRLIRYLGRGTRQAA